MRARAIIVAFFLALALAVFAWPRVRATTAAAQTERRNAPAGVRKLRVDYTRFSHRTQQHQLACDNCHKFPSANWQQVRKKDEAFPDITEYPQHQSCLNCHRQQFFARERPAPAICSVCHVASSPRNTTRYPFPSLGTAFLAAPRGQNFASDFSVYFTHDKHVELVGRQAPVVKPNARVRFVAAAFAQEQKEAEAQADKSCAVCHQTYQPQGDANDEYVTKPPQNVDDAFWLKKGTFKTIPVSHAACFTCHSQDNTDLKPGPADCAMCHKLAPPAPPAHMDFDPHTAATEGITDHTILAAWRARTSAATFRHEGGLHPTLACTACHNVTALDTLDHKTKVVPVQTCGGAGTGCHITTTPDEVGALNFEVDAKRAKPVFQCTKCHLNYGKEPIPKSHESTLPALKPQ